MKALPKDGVKAEEVAMPARDEVSPSMLWPTLILAAGLIILGFMNAFIVKGVLKYINFLGM